MVICLEQGADLHMVQLIPLPLTVSCSSKIQIGFTFLVPAHPGSPGQRDVKWVCVYTDSRAFQFAIRIDSFSKKNRHLDSLVVMQFFLLIYCIVSAKKCTTMHAIESYTV